MAGLDDLLRTLTPPLRRKTREQYAIRIGYAEDWGGPPVLEMAPADFLELWDFHDEDWGINMARGVLYALKTVQ